MRPKPSNVFFSLRSGKNKSQKNSCFSFQLDLGGSDDFCHFHVLHPLEMEVSNQDLVHNICATTLDKNSQECSLTCGFAHFKAPRATVPVHCIPTNCDTLR